MGARDSSTGKKDGYVVPPPRVTDAMGQSLCRAFRPRDDDAAFADLLSRLDTLH